jgi:hypothetical protein
MPDCWQPTRAVWIHRPARRRVGVDTRHTGPDNGHPDGVRRSVCCACYRHCVGDERRDLAASAERGNRVPLRLPPQADSMVITAGGDPRIVAPLTPNPGQALSAVSELRPDGERSRGWTVRARSIQERAFDDSCTVVGGCPYADPDPSAHLDLVLAWPPTPISTRGPRRRSIRRTPTAVRC